MSMSSVRRVGVASFVLSATITEMPRGACARGSDPTSIALIAPSCEASALELEALWSILRIELASTLGAQPTRTTVTSEAAYSIELNCTRSDHVEIHATRSASGTAASESFDWSQLPVTARPRILAIAIAEQIRTLPAVPVDASPVAQAPVERTPPTASVRPLATGRLKLTRGLTIGFGGLTIASLVIGASLLGIGEQDRSQPIAGLVVPGATLVTLGGVSLAVTAVALTMWVKDRKRSTHR